MTKKQKSWLNAYYTRWATQAEVMRKLNLKNRNDFYRLFHHFMIDYRDKIKNEL